MKIICPKCSTEYEIESGMIGQKVECQQCGFHWIVESDTIPKMKPCPMCGESILAVAKKCRFCGEYLSKDAIPVRRKDRTTYCLLGILLGGWGVHNFYAGQFPAGIVKLIFSAIGIAAVASCPPHEAAKVWIAPAAVILYFTIWDICYDPNIPTKDRKKILGISPWLISLLLLIALYAVLGLTFTMIQR